MPNHYILGVNHEEIERLQIQANVFNKFTKPLITQHISPGDHVLEIGSGTGGVSEVIASLLLSCGSLTCIEQEEKYVEFLKKRMINNGFYHVEIINADIITYQSQHHYDLIYTRAVLHHIKNAFTIIDKLKDFLFDRGKIIIEEPVMTDLLTAHDAPAMRKLHQAYTQLADALDLDLNIGRKLSTYMEQAGLVVEHYQFTQLALNTVKERNLIIQWLNSISSGLITHNILSESEINELKKDLEKLAQSNERILYVPFGQIVARSGVK